MPVARLRQEMSAAEYMRWLAYSTVRNKLNAQAERRQARMQRRGGKG